MPRSILVMILIPFSVLSAIALWQHGYWGLLAPHFQTFGAGQVLADLVIALTLVMTWMWRNAKATRRVIWPWIIATLILGSFGPLLYLLTSKPVTQSR